MTKHTSDMCLDLGIALDHGAFDINKGTIDYHPLATQLIYFALHLFKRLRPLAAGLPASASTSPPGHRPPATPRSYA